MARLQKLKKKVRTKRKRNLSKNFRFNLIEEYKKSWKYLKESKTFVFVIMGIFALFVILGAFAPVPAQIQERIFDFIKEVLEETKNLSVFGMIKFIFWNNLKSSFFGMVFGSVFGVFSVMNSLINGYVLGFVSALTVQNESIFSLWRLFPHGIFELPAIFISLGMGLKLGTFIFHKKKTEILKNYLINSLRIFFLIVLPLLVIAGIIEGSFMFLF